MNTLLFSAGVVSLIVGLIHSILGEILIFKKLRSGTIIPTLGGSLLQERNIRILWATWHVVTVFGCLLAAILIKLSFLVSADGNFDFIIQFIAYSMFASSILVFVATKARHPGWIGLLIVGTLCQLA